MDWVEIVAIGGCVLWGMKGMRAIYRRSDRPPGITVHNGEYRALVENLEQLKRATNEMLTGHKLTADILSSMAAKQEAMAGILDSLPCRAGAAQLIQPTQAAATCGLSTSSRPSSTLSTSMESAG